MELSFFSMTFKSCHCVLCKQPLGCTRRETEPWAVGPRPGIWLFMWCLSLRVSEQGPSSGTVCWTHGWSGLVCTSSTHSRVSMGLEPVLNHWEELTHRSMRQQKAGSWLGSLNYLLGLQVGPRPPVVEEIHPWQPPVLGGLA